MLIENDSSQRRSWSNFMQFHLQHLQSSNCNLQVISSKQTNLHHKSPHDTARIDSHFSASFLALNCKSAANQQKDKSWRDLRPRSFSAISKVHRRAAIFCRIITSFQSSSIVNNSHKANPPTRSIFVIACTSHWPPKTHEFTFAKNDKLKVTSNLLWYFFFASRHRFLTSLGESISVCCVFVSRIVGKHHLTTLTRSSSGVCSARKDNQSRVNNMKKGIRR